MSGVEFPDDFVPSPSDQAEAVEGYIDYLHGVSFFAEPLLTADLHQQDTKNTELVASFASLVIIRGLRQVIVHIHPPELRGPLKNLRGNHQQALIPMLEVQDETFAREENYEQIRPELLDTFREIRPFAICDPTPYHRICNSQYDDLSVRDLTDGVKPHYMFAHYDRSGPKKLTGLNPLLTDLLAEQADEALEAASNVLRFPIPKSASE